MSGIGGQETKGKIVTAQIPMPSTVDDIVDVLREIILKGHIVGISVKNGEPITYERFVPEGVELSPDDTHGYVDLDPIDILRNVEMDEFNESDYGMEDLEGSSQLMWMFLLLEGQGYAVTHIVLSEDSTFWQWIGIASMAARSMDKFLGARIVFEASIPPNAFLLCGSPHRAATIAEIKFALKGNVPGVEHDGTDEEGS